MGANNISVLFYFNIYFSINYLQYYVKHFELVQIETFNTGSLNSFRILLIIDS